LFLFIIYAVGIWFAAGRWRREWRGLLSVVGGVAGVLLVGYLHIRLNEWTKGGIYLPVLQSILYPFGALVGFVGLFIVTLPRTQIPSSCSRCGYDLQGQEESPPICPECGAASNHKHAPGETRRSDPAPPHYDPIAAARARQHARREIAGWRDRSTRF